MISKIQKTWLWVFGAMVILPEVLFSPIISFTLFLTKINFNSLYSLGVKASLLPDSLTWLLAAIIIELIGSGGLFILNLKLGQKGFMILFGLAFVYLCFILFFVYSLSHMGF